jgi:hypothetical protein
VYGVYLQAFPSLSYDAVNVYVLTIACTDTKDTVTGTLHVYIKRNNAPVLTNLQGISCPYVFIFKPQLISQKTKKKINHTPGSCFIKELMTKTKN